MKGQANVGESASSLRGMVRLSLSVGGPESAPFPRCLRPWVPQPSTREPEERGHARGIAAYSCALLCAAGPSRVVKGTLRACGACVRRRNATQRNAMQCNTSKKGVLQPKAHEARGT